MSSKTKKVKFNGVRYILTLWEEGSERQVVSDSKSEQMFEETEITGEEKALRLELADDILYLKGSIKDVIIKTTDGNQFSLLPQVNVDVKVRPSQPKRPKGRQAK